MNERIEELSLQCIRYKLIAEGARSDFDYKKFAELIIQECATVILNNDIEKQEDYGVNHLFFNGWERGVIDSCHTIKEHFGIEE